MASATKKIKINGALYRLSTGVQVWTRRGKSQLVARIPQSDGIIEYKSRWSRPLAGAGWGVLLSSDKRETPRQADA